MATITLEAPEHIDAIRRLTVDAFAASDFGHHGEAELIDQIRDKCEDTISLVAIVDGQVVGHILFSHATIHSKELTLYGMGLGPMAVQPEHQNRGIGSMLVQEGLRAVAQLKLPFTIVTGHPDYYRRFGFVPALQHSITHGFAGMPQHIFFIHCDDDTLPDNLIDAKAYYHSAFGPQFDR